MAANSNSMQGGAWQVTTALDVIDTATKTWTHNRGRKAQMVFIVDTTSKNRLPLTFTVTQPNVNQITITNNTGLDQTVDVVVFWDPPTQDQRAPVDPSAWV